MKFIPTTRAELARTAILLGLLAIALVYPFATRGPCEFPHAAMDRDYDFQVHFESFTYDGNSGNYFDYLLLFGLLLSPWDWSYDFTIDFYGIDYEGNSGNVIDRVILATGAWELPVLSFLRDATEGLASGQGVFLDVGASTGQHSLFMSRFCSSVYSVEPYPPVLARFRRSIAINQIENIVLCPVGLGDENAQIPFYAPPDWNQGQGSFVQGFSSDNSFQDQLEIVVGDELLHSLGNPTIHAVKIDVEGYEKAVLVGLRETLRNHRPVVVVEVTPEVEQGFKNTEQLLAVLPPEYAVLEFFFDAREWCKGKYVLVERTGDFTTVTTLVLYPSEKQNRLPFTIVSEVTTRVGEDVCNDPA